jgi:hypothetical protein
VFPIGEFEPGDIIEADSSQCTWVIFDHHAKLAIQLNNRKTGSPTEGYILVEELGPKMSKLSWAWTDAQTRHVQAQDEASQNCAQQEMEAALNAIIKSLPLYCRPVLTMVRVDT